MWIDEQAPEREVRASALLADRQPRTWPDVVIPEGLDGCHAVAARTAKRLGTSTTKRIPEANGKDLLTVSVSPVHKDRAPRILDGTVKAALAAGGLLGPAKAHGPQLHLEVLGQFVSLRFEEQFDRTLREPTAKELAEQAKYEWRKPDLRVDTPNGKLKLMVLSANRYSPYFTLSDGTQTPLKQRLSDLVEKSGPKPQA